MLETQRRGPSTPAFAHPILKAFRSDRVIELACVLAHLVEDGAFDDHSLFPEPRDDRNARRLLWREENGSLAIVAMTWVPGQQSPLHDHRGLWGAEVVVDGLIRETPFELVGRQPEGLYQFFRGRPGLLARGAVSTLLPPAEYHEFGNVGDSFAHTVHVYSGEIERCTSFSPAHGSWWRAATAELGYDV